MTDTVYFTQLDENRFQANDPARGPWSRGHCHAGPVTGLVVRALEQAIPDKMLTRITLDLIRPIPMAEIRVTAQSTRNGRSVSAGSAEIRDADDRVCVTATSMHLVKSDIPDMPTAATPDLTYADADFGPPPLPMGMHDVPAFGHFVKTAYPKGTSNGLGPKTVWMKAPPLLETEVPSPIQTLCALADSGNAISRNAEISAMGFLNTDLTIHVHREPVSDWLASTTESHWQSTGIGLAQAVISDDQGPVACALQTLMLRPPPLR